MGNPQGYGWVLLWASVFSFPDTTPPSPPRYTFRTQKSKPSWHICFSSTTIWCSHKAEHPALTSAGRACLTEVLNTESQLHFLCTLLRVGCNSKQRIFSASYATFSKKTFGMRQLCHGSLLRTPVGTRLSSGHEAE